MIPLITNPIVTGALCAIGLYFKAHEPIIRMLKRCLQPRAEKNEFRIRRRERRRQMLHQARVYYHLRQHRRNQHRTGRRLALLRRDQINVNLGQRHEPQFTDTQPLMRIDRDNVNHELIQVEDPQIIDAQILIRGGEDLANVNHGFIQTEDPQITDAEILIRSGEDRVVDPTRDPTGRENRLAFDRLSLLTRDPDQAIETQIVAGNEPEHLIESQRVRSEKEQAMVIQDFARSEKNLSMAGQIFNTSEHGQVNDTQAYLPSEDVYQMEASNPENLVLLLEEISNLLNKLVQPAVNSNFHSNLHRFQEETKEADLPTNLHRFQEETKEADLPTNSHPFLTEAYNHFDIALNDCLMNSNNDLALNMYNILSEEVGNILFSPFCISAYNAILLCVGEANRESEMREYFKNYAYLMENDTITNTMFRVNTMFTQKGLKIKQPYKQVIEEFFKTLTLEVDFINENEQAVTSINEWVNEKTNGMIPKFVESLDPSSLLLLLDAVYFKSPWMHKFDEKLTSQRNFWNYGSTDNAQFIAMMTGTHHFPYYEDENVQVLELPYNEEQVAMLVLLPRERNGLKSVEASLKPSFVQDLKKRLFTTTVKVTFPRFCLEYTRSLSPNFERLGIVRSLCELGDLPDNSISVDLIHKAVLEVKENSGETAIKAEIPRDMICSLPWHPQFTVDHPFAFIVYDKVSDFVLLMGRVNELY